MVRHDLVDVGSFLGKTLGIVSSRKIFLGTSLLGLLKMLKDKHFLSKTLVKAEHYSTCNKMR